MIVRVPLGVTDPQYQEPTKLDEGLCLSVLRRGWKLRQARSMPEAA